MVTRGGLILRDCLLTLRGMPKNIKQKIPCLVTFPNTKINLVNCEFMGNDSNMTAGCLFLNTDVVMSSCKFNNFRAGGIFSVADREQNPTLIKDCEINKCGTVGIYC
jgi:hypothetical protein